MVRTDIPGFISDSAADSTNMLASKLARQLFVINGRIQDEEKIILSGGFIMSLSRKTITVLGGVNWASSRRGEEMSRERCGHCI